MLNFILKPSRPANHPHYGHQSNYHGCQNGNRLGNHNCIRVIAKALNRVLLHVFPTLHFVFLLLFNLVKHGFYILSTIKLQEAVARAVSKSSVFMFLFFLRVIIDGRLSYS